MTMRERIETGKLFTDDKKPDLFRDFQPGKDLNKVKLSFIQKEHSKNTD